jgi:cytochrome P450
MQIFLASLHPDANDVFRNKSLGRIFKDKTPEFEWEIFNWLHADSILDSEPPKHTRLRSLVAKAFNRQKIEGMRPAVERITDRLLDGIDQKVKAGENFDLIADYAEPLPVRIIADLLGFPESEEHLLRPWSQSIVKMYEVNPSAQHQQEAKLAASEFADYVRDLAISRKTNPGQDLITDLATVEENGEKLNMHELVATCILLLNAGHEASVNAFGNGMVAALQRPDQIKLLRETPREITNTALEEFMRFDAPLHLFERTATADTEVGGVAIKEGQKIAALIGSANRDETVFSAPESMDLTRDPNPHIGFGAGIHFCLGAPLARLEMSVSLPALWERYPTMQLASDPVRRPTFVLRGYESVAISV